MTGACRSRNLPQTVFLSGPFQTYLSVQLENGHIHCTLWAILQWIVSLVRQLGKMTPAKCLGQYLTKKQDDRHKNTVYHTFSFRLVCAFHYDRHFWFHRASPPYLGSSERGGLASFDGPLHPGKTSLGGSMSVLTLAFMVRSCLLPSSKSQSFTAFHRGFRYSEHV
jgi:hypothetical protein